MLFRSPADLCADPQETRLGDGPMTAVEQLGAQRLALPRDLLDLGPLLLTQMEVTQQLKALTDPDVPETDGVEVGVRRLVQDPARPLERTSRDAGLSENHPSARGDVLFVTADSDRLLGETNSLLYLTTTERDGREAA